MLSFEDKLLIKNLWECKGLSSRWLIKEFPNKNWKRRTLDNFLRKLPTAGTIERTAGSGRPQSVRTADNIAAVEELVQSPGRQASDTSVNLTNLQRAQNSANIGKAHYPQQFKTQMLERRRVQELVAVWKEGSGTAHCWHFHWSMAPSSDSLHQSKRRTFWAQPVINIWTYSLTGIHRCVIKHIVNTDVNMGCFMLFLVLRGKGET